MYDQQQLSDYELNLLAEILAFCETTNQPYIHDNELQSLPRSGEHPVMVAETLSKFNRKGYLEQNRWEQDGIPHYWWQLTCEAMAIVNPEKLKTGDVDPTSHPSWIEQLPDTFLRNVLDEVYRARSGGFLMLPLVGHGPHLIEPCC
jgi:hypothetical protein